MQNFTSPASKAVGSPAVALPDTLEEISTGQPEWIKRPKQKPCAVQNAFVAER